MQRKVIGSLIFLSLFSFLLFEHQPLMAYQVDQKLYNELLKLDTDGKIVIHEGVPCVKVNLKQGESISKVCGNVPGLYDDYFVCKSKLALINRLEALAIVGGKDSVSTNKTSIYVPVDLTATPHILPEYRSDIAGHRKFLLIDVGKQALGRYEYGKLKKAYPISSGMGPKATPLRNFNVIYKIVDTYSRTYGMAWMPYSINIFADYYVHGGILPGYDASHGCIRLNFYDAIEVFEWAEKGMPGAVVKT